MKREAILAGFVPRKAGRPRKKQLEEEELPKPVAEPKPVEPQPKPLPEPERVTEPTCIESGIRGASVAFSSKGHTTNGAAFL